MIMFFNDVVVTTLVIFLGVNVSVALLFWLHERLEHTAAGRLREAVEKSVRAVEQLCITFDNPEKKRQAVLRVEALLGWYKLFIPSLVIDTAIEAEVYLIKHLHQKLSVDHDAPDEVICGEGSE
jgi:hypothetical protein